MCLRGLAKWSVMKFINYTTTYMFTVVALFNDSSRRINHGEYLNSTLVWFSEAVLPRLYCHSKHAAMCNPLLYVIFLSLLSRVHVEALLINIRPYQFAILQSHNFYRRFEPASNMRYMVSYFCFYCFAFTARPTMVLNNCISGVKNSQLL